MRLILDTHVFLWFVTADPKLIKVYQTAIQDPANEVYLSAASVWEAVIKFGLGKLAVPSSPADYFVRLRAAHGIASLPIDEAAMSYLESLPKIYRDPFDRLIIAQALQHDLTLITVDSDVRAYPVRWLPDV